MVQEIQIIFIRPLKVNLFCVQFMNMNLNNILWLNSRKKEIKTWNQQVIWPSCLARVVIRCLSLGRLRGSPPLSGMVGEEGRRRRELVNSMPMLPVLADEDAGLGTLSVWDCGLRFTRAWENKMFWWIIYIYIYSKANLWFGFCVEYSIDINSGFIFIIRVIRDDQDQEIVYQVCNWKLKLP